MAEFYVSATLFLVRESISKKLDKPVQQHIAELDGGIQRLSEEIMRTHTTRRQRNRIESELRVTQQALELYEKAIARMLIRLTAV